MASAIARLTNAFSPAVGTGKVDKSLPYLFTVALGLADTLAAQGTLHGEWVAPVLAAAHALYGFYIGHAGTSDQPGAK